MRLFSKRPTGGADLKSPYFYLAGPMSNIAKFNFPAFNASAAHLRKQGYNIVNPAEFDYEIARAIHAREDGSHKKLTEFLAAQGIKAPSWAECLRRDITYVADDNCVGVICQDGWEHSQGAQFETYVAYKLLKPIYKLNISLADYDPDISLTLIERRKALEAAGVVDG